MTLPKEEETLDPFFDPRVKEAEARHAKRRRRTGHIYDVLDWVFYLCLFVVVLLVFKMFLERVVPHLA